MGIFQKIFRKKQTIRSYKDSPNREGYERVAAKLQLPPDYIYEISHRGGVKSRMDYDNYRIIQALIDEGVLKKSSDTPSEKE